MFARTDNMYYWRTWLCQFLHCNNFICLVCFCMFLTCFISYCPVTVSGIYGLYICTHVCTYVCMYVSVACVCSSLCYGWTKVDVECLQGKGKFRNITCLWRYGAKCRYRATHFQCRPHFGVRVQHQELAVLQPRIKQSTLFYRWMDGPQVPFVQAWRKENPSHPPGF